MQQIFLPPCKLMMTLISLDVRHGRKHESELKFVLKYILQARISTGMDTKSKAYILKE